MFYIYVHLYYEIKIKYFRYHQSMYYQTILSIELLAKQSFESMQEQHVKKQDGNPTNVSVDKGSMKWGRWFDEEYDVLHVSSFVFTFNFSYCQQKPYERISMSVQRTNGRKKWSLNIEWNANMWAGGDRYDDTIAEWRSIRWWQLWASAAINELHGRWSKVFEYTICQTNQEHNHIPIMSKFFRMR